MNIKTTIFPKIVVFSSFFVDFIFAIWYYSNSFVMKAERTVLYESSQFKPDNADGGFFSSTNNRT